MSLMPDERFHMRESLLDHFKNGHSLKQSKQAMKYQFGQALPGRTWFWRWWNRFEQGQFQLEDLERSGRPVTSDSEPVLSALLEQPNSSTRDITKTTGVPKSTVNRILHRENKVPKKLQVVPHELTPAQKIRRVDVCTQNLLLKHPKGLLRSTIAQDEKWVYFSNPACNPVWVDFDAPPATRPKRDLHGKKLLLSFWFSVHGVVHWRILPDNITVTGKTISEELLDVKKKAPSISPYLAKPYLIWDNARPHKSKITREALVEAGITEISHPPYSPDISPCDYHAFRSLQDFCYGKKMMTKSDVETVISDWIATRPVDFWSNGIKSLPDRWRNVVATNGAYIID